MWLSRTVAVSSWRTNIIKLIIHCSREPEALDGTLTTVYWETHHSSAALRRRMKSILIDLPSSLKPINDNHYFPFVHYDPHSSIKKVSNTHFRSVCCAVSLTLSPQGPQQGGKHNKWQMNAHFHRACQYRFVSSYNLSQFRSKPVHHTAPSIRPSSKLITTTGTNCAPCSSLYW